MFLSTMFNSVNMAVEIVISMSMVVNLKDLEL